MNNKKRGKNVKKGNQGYKYFGTNVASIWVKDGISRFSFLRYCGSVDMGLPSKYTVCNISRFFSSSNICQLSMWLWLNYNSEWKGKKTNKFGQNYRNTLPRSTLPKTLSTSWGVKHSVLSWSDCSPGQVYPSWPAGSLVSTQQKNKSIQESHFANLKFRNICESIQSIVVLIGSDL